MGKLIVICAVLLSACAAPTKWMHPEKTQEQFNADSYDCNQVAHQYAANLGFNGNPLIVGEQYKKCMMYKYGYRRE